MISLILFLTMIIGTQGFAKLPNGDGSRGGGTAGSLRRAVSDWIAGGALKNTVVETYGPIEDWDVSEVTNMKYVFYGSGSSASTFGSFNADLSKWNTGAVTTMNAMFIMASAFNQDVSNWNTGAVIDMAFMFYGASLFNQDVSNWNTGAVIDMAYMFNSALVFNQDVSKWNTGAVTQMKGMFYYAWAFNSDVSNWNTSAVTTMKNMFFNSGFTRTLCGGTWESLPGITNAFDNLGTSTARLGCCSPGTYMAQPNLHPFSEATACAACPIGQYGSAVEDDITSCTACAAVTDGTCTACTSALAGSCTAVKCVAGRSSMDNDANNGCEVATLPNGDESYSATGNTRSLRRVVSDWIAGGAFKSTVVATYGPIEDWDVSEVTNMKNVFYGWQLASTFGSFNADLSKWDVSRVTTMYEMFLFASAFNQNVSTWNTGAVTSMASMFYGASAFNQDVSTWNTGAVTDMQQMFMQASAFNQDVSKWNTGAVTNMQSMFGDTFSFNQDVSKWNTGAVTNMQSMFSSASAFNSDLSKWNTGAVTDMSWMFYSAYAFNSDVSNWNTGAVTRMRQSKCTLSPSLWPRLSLLYILNIRQLEFDRITLLTRFVFKCFT